MSGCGSSGCVVVHTGVLHVAKGVLECGSSVTHLFGSSHGTERELDGVDIVVDGLGEPDDGEIIAAASSLDYRGVRGERHGVEG